MTGKHIGPGKRLKLELFAKLQDKRIEEHRLRQRLPREFRGKGYARFRFPAGD